MREPYRTIFLALVVILSFGLVKACDVKAGPKIKEKQEFQDLQNNPKVTLELIAISADGEIKFYRMVDCNAPGISCQLCYITVGELHGNTVAMECK